MCRVLEILCRDEDIDQGESVSHDQYSERIARKFSKGIVAPLPLSFSLSLSLSQIIQLIIRIFKKSELDEQYLLFTGWTTAQRGEVVTFTVNHMLLNQTFNKPPPK